MPAHASERHDALFAAHHDAVWRYAVRRVGAEVAEDIVAETFLIAWRRIEVVPAHELPWLLGVARKVIANQRRGERRRAQLTLRLAQTHAPAPSPPDAPSDAILAALTTLAERDQEALRLVYWDGLDPAEAARALGCTAVAMRVRLHRARARLARALTQQDRSPRLTATEA